MYKEISESKFVGNPFSSFNKDAGSHNAPAVFGGFPPEAGFLLQSSYFKCVWGFFFGGGGRDEGVAVE